MVILIYKKVETLFEKDKNMLGDQHGKDFKE